jgi:hypothetical protein
MAVYKVPQDVEAEDKLLGPFSFRQFVYLIIAGVAGIVAWLMWNLSPPLAVIPLPIIVFFVILALPLRKDQPMEIYLIAVVQFFLKPKKRLWAPDGTMSLVQITAPKTVEKRRAKSLSENEAVNRLSYLAEIMDTRGWAARGVQDMGTAVNDAVATEAAETEDVLDRQASVAQSFDALIERKDATRRQDAIATMRKQATQPTETQSTIRPSGSMPSIPGNPYSQFTSHPPVDETPRTPSTPYNDDKHPVSATPVNDADVHYNPYPTSIHQQVVQPIGQHTQQPQPAYYHHDNPPVQVPATEPRQPEKKPGASEVSPDIINLANNTDFTISTIAHEAQRIQQKQNDETEVIIPLR